MVDICPQIVGDNSLINWTDELIKQTKERKFEQAVDRECFWQKVSPKLPQDWKKLSPKGGTYPQI